jgi:lysophospholipase L1-like esterase
MSRPVPPLSALLVAGIAVVAFIVPAAGAADAAEVFAPRVVVAMGDSITRAAVADGTMNDNSDYGWATGSSTAVRSHVTRLAERQGWRPSAYNVALGGTTSDDLVRQASSAVARGADYVTILSGANDVCRATSTSTLPSPDAVAANLASALRVINEGRPAARILLASIPNIRSLYAAGMTTDGAPLVWSFAGICPIALADPLDRSPAAEERRAAVEANIAAVNRAMAAVCARAASCVDDDGAVFAMAVEPADLSPLDYFHPSVTGQAKIAAVTWQKALDKGLFAAAPSAPAPSPPAPTELVIDETSPSIVWTGEWSSTRSALDSGGSVAFIKAMRSGFSLAFTGTRVSVVARTTPSAGISEVRIDGVLVARVDSYSESPRHQQVIFRSDGLAPGEHRITVTATSDLNPASTGRNLILDALVVESSSP